jgi:hypothetical protein
MSGVQRMSSSRRDFLVNMGTMVGAAAVAASLSPAADARALPHLTTQDREPRSEPHCGRSVYQLQTLPGQQR